MSKTYDWTFDASTRTHGAFNTIGRWCGPPATVLLTGLSRLPVGQEVVIEVASGAGPLNVDYPPDVAVTGELPIREGRSAIFVAIHPEPV